MLSVCFVKQIFSEIVNALSISIQERKCNLQSTFFSGWHGFLQTTIWVCTQNNNRNVKKKTFQKPEHSKKYVVLAKCIENAVLREKYCQQKRGKWAIETKQAAYNKLG